MIVQCEHCRTKFRLSDDRITGRGVKVRCSKCAHVFTVYGGAAKAEPSLPPQASAAMSLPSMPPPPPMSAGSGLPGPPSHPPGLGLDRPMHSGDLMAAIDDLMLPGTSGPSPSSSFGGASSAAMGLDLPPVGAPPGAFGGPPGAAFGGPPGAAFGGPSGPFGPGAFGAASPPPPPSNWGGGPPEDMFGGVPQIPFGPPGSLPPMPNTGGDGLAELEAGFRFAGIAEERPSQDPFKAASMALDAAPSRPPSVDLPPRPSFDLGSSRPPSIELPMPPRQSWSLPFTSGVSGPGTSQPPAAAPKAPIKAPTFPPPPVFDPFLDAPKSLPPAPAQESEARTDQFILGNNASNDDPFAGLGEPYQGPSGNDGFAIDVDMGEGAAPAPPKPDQQVLAKLDLKKGLLGNAGVVTFSSDDATTRHNPKLAEDAEAAAAAAGARKKALARTAALFAVLIALLAFAISNERSSRETRIGGISLFETPSLTPGAIRSVEAKEARVVAYPLHSQAPHLVVTGVAINRGDTLAQELEVVALMMDGERIVEQRSAPLGALIPLDALAKAGNPEELEAAWAAAPRAVGALATHEERPFMVVFPALPDEIQRYTFVVEFRPITTAAATP